MAAEEYKVLVGAELDDASFNALKNEIEGKLNSKDIKARIHVDTEGARKKLTYLKNKIDKLCKTYDIKINVNTTDFYKSIDPKTSNLRKIDQDYNRLYKTQKKIADLRKERAGLDVTKDANRIAELTKQIKDYEKESKKLFSSIKSKSEDGKLSDWQKQRLRDLHKENRSKIKIKDSHKSDKDRIDRENKEIQDKYNKEKKEQEKVNAHYKELYNIKKEIYDLEEKKSRLDKNKNKHEIEEIDKQLADKRRIRKNLQRRSINDKLSDEQNKSLQALDDNSKNKIRLNKQKNKDIKNKEEAKRKEQEEKDRIKKDQEKERQNQERINDAYNKMHDTQQKIGKIRTKLASLDPKKNANEILKQNKLLNEQLGIYNDLEKEHGQYLTDKQRSRLNQLEKDSKNDARIASSRVYDAKRLKADEIIGNNVNGNYKNKVDKFTNDFNKIINKSDELTNASNKLQNAYRELNAAIQSDNVDDIAIKYRNYANALSQANNVLAESKRNQSNDNAVSKLDFDRQYLSNDIDVWLKNNSAAANLFGSKLDEIKSKLKSCDNVELDNLRNEFKLIKQEAEIAGKATKTFSDKMKDQLGKLNVYFSASEVLHGAMQVVQNMFQNVLDVDTAMTELYRVTDLTESGYNQLYDNMIDSAKQYGATLSDVITSTADWVRLGFDAQTSNRLTEVTAMYQHVSDLDNATAVENLVTAYKGFEDELSGLYNGDSAAAVEYIADIFNELGNKFAVSAADVGAGLSRAASTLDIGGNSIQESAAMVTGITEVTQDPTKAGNALKILALRLRGMKGQLQELGEEVDSNVESISKMQTQVLNMTEGKVNIFNDDGTFKSTYQIMDEISAVYDDLTDIQQTDLLETIAGKNRANDIASLISNWNNVEAAMLAATGAEGSATEENEKYMESLQGKIDALTAAWQALSNTILNTDFLKGGLDSATSFLSILENIISFLGGSSILSGIAGFIALTQASKIGKGTNFLFGAGKGEIFGTYKEHRKEGKNRRESVVGSVKDWNQTTSAIGKAAGAFGVLGMAIGAASTIYGIYKQNQEQKIENSQVEIDQYKETTTALEEYSTKVKELRSALDSGELTPEQEASTRSQLIDIENQIAEAYGVQASQLDLVNGKLSEQLDLISQIGNAELRNWYQNNKGVIEDAEKEMTNGDISLDFSAGNKLFRIKERENVDEIMKSIWGENAGVSNDSAGKLVIPESSDIRKSYNELSDFYDLIEIERDKFSKDDAEYKYYDNLLDAISKKKSDFEEIISEYGDDFDYAQQYKITKEGSKYEEDWEIYESQIKAIDEAKKAGKSATEEYQAAYNTLQKMLKQAQEDGDTALSTFLQNQIDSLAGEDVNLQLQSKIDFRDKNNPFIQSIEEASRYFEKDGKIDLSEVEKAYNEWLQGNVNEQSIYYGELVKAAEEYGVTVDELISFINSKGEIPETFATIDDMKKSFSEMLSEGFDTDEAKEKLQSFIDTIYALNPEMFSEFNIGELLGLSGSENVDFSSLSSILDYLYNISDIGDDALEVIRMILSSFGMEDYEIDSIFGKFDINKEFLDKNKININIDDEGLQGEIDKAEKILNEGITFDEEKGEFKFTPDAEEAQKVLEYLIERKHIVEEPAIMSVDTSELTGDVKDATEYTMDFQKAWEEFDEGYQTANIEKAQKGLNLMSKYAGELVKLDTSTLFEMGFTQEDIDSLNILSQLEPKEIDVMTDFSSVQKDVTNVESAIKGIDATIIPKIGTDGISSNTNLLNGSILYTPIFPEGDAPDKDGVAKYTADWSKIGTPPPKKSTVTYTVWYDTNGDGIGDTTTKPAGVNGTAHVLGTAFANGTAFKQGNWGTKGSGTALMGELGQETIVRDGRFFTVGDNGAGFYKYQKGDIIFNHKQTEELFKHGKVTSGGGRGRAIANGTAFSNGTVKSGKAFAKGIAFASGSDKGETFDWIETLLDRLERVIDKLDKAATNAFKSWDERDKALSDQTAEIKKQIETYQQAEVEYMEKANSVGLSQDWITKIQNGSLDISDVKDEKLAEKINEYKEWYEKSLDVKDATDELTESLLECYATAFDNAMAQYEGLLDHLDHEKDMIDEYVSQEEAKGRIVNTNYYVAKMELEQKSIEKNKELRDKLIEEFNTAVANGLEPYSEEWHEMRNDIDEVTLAIAESETNILELSNAIRDVEWEVFDRLQEKASRFVDEMDFLVELMSEDKLHEDNGKLTNKGMATMGLYTSQYVANMSQSETIKKEIDEVKNLLKDDPYNTELINRLYELEDAQKDCISSAYDMKSAIVDLVEEGIQLELSSLQELIDEYNEALQSQKDLYDYQKKVQKQTKEISDIEKQLAAYEGDDSEESRAKIYELRSALEDANNDLEETQYDKYISDQQKLLDNLYVEYEEILSSRLDDTEKLVSDMMEIINQNSGSIEETITEVAEKNGYDLSQEMQKLWGSDSDIVSIYNNGFEKINSTNSILQHIASTVDFMSDGKNLNNGETSLEKITSAGIVYSPEYWESLLNNNSVEYLDQLFDNISELAQPYVVKPINNIDEAIDRLVEVGAINTPEYWEKQVQEVDHLGTFLIRAAQQVLPKSESSVSTYGGYIKPISSNNVQGGRSGGSFVFSGDTEFSNSGQALTPVEYIREDLSGLLNEFSNVAKEERDDLLDMMQYEINSISDAIKGVVQDIHYSTLNGTGNNSYSQHFENINFNFPNVKNYDEIISALKDDNKFTRLIESMTFDKMLGNNLSKGKSI